MTFGQTAEEPQSIGTVDIYYLYLDSSVISRYLDSSVISRYLDSCAMIHSAGKTSSATRLLIKMRPALMSGPLLQQHCRHDRTLDSDNATLWRAPYFV